MKSNKFFYSLGLIILFITLVTPVRSQILISILLGDKLNTGAIEFGLTGGFNRNNMFPLRETSGINNFNLGFYFDFRLKKDKPYYLYTGVLVKSNMGASDVAVYSLDDQNLDSVMSDGYINRIVSYFNVPIALKYRFKNNIFVLGGAQLGLRHKARDEFTTSIEKKDDIVYKEETKDNYRRIDAGATLGAGYKFRYGVMMNIGVRYYYGFSNVFKGQFKADYGPTTNSSLYVFAEIPIGAERKVRPPKEEKDKKRKKNK